MVRVALVQMNSCFEKERNIEKAKTYCRQAAANGARIVCFNELFSTIYFCNQYNPGYIRWAEPVPGPTTEEMANIAREENILLVTPIYEEERKGLYYNTAVVLGPNGELIGKYRKSHIPLTRGPEGTDKAYIMEKLYFTPGDTGFEVFLTPFGIRIGILICFDRHFPEAARVIGLKGADLLLVPSSAPDVIKHMWEAELKAHALANAYYVGGVNRAGKDSGGADIHWHGASLFIDPRGQTMAQAGAEEDEIVYADLDIEALAELRFHMGYYRDRRPELYNRIVSY